MLTEPLEAVPRRATVVFLNSGSEPHVGSGRVWVEYARRLAVLGHRSVRTDFRGWGESPDDGHAPGRPYDPHCQEDTVTLVRALQERGHDRIVLVGLCAAAWTALRVVLTEPVAGIVALNPQFYWRQGDPVESTLAETRTRRTAERLRDAKGGRWGWWSGLDLLGHRPWPARWLDDLAASGVPIHLLFAEGDDGLEHLQDRLRRRLGRAQRRGTITLEVMAEVDHSMHRAWARETVVAALRAQLDRLDAAQVS